MFAPLSIVRIEANSEPIDLGEFRATAEGGLDVTIDLTNVPVGFHTLHVYGTSADGEDIDYYQDVEIREVAGDIPEAIEKEKSFWSPSGSRPGVRMDIADLKGGVGAVSYRETFGASAIGTSVLERNVAAEVPGVMGTDDKSLVADGLVSSGYANVADVKFNESDRSLSHSAQIQRSPIIWTTLLLAVSAVLGVVMLYHWRKR